MRPKIWYSFQSGLGNRYNLHTDVSGLIISGSNYGLVQQVCSRLGDFQYIRCLLLSGGTRKSVVKE